MSTIEYFDPRGPTPLVEPRDFHSFSDIQGASSSTTPEFALHEIGNRLIYPNWNARGVLSPFWRLYVNAESGVKVWHDGREFALNPDKVWLLAENTRFDCRVENPVSHLWLHFSVRPTYAFDLSEPMGVPVDEGLQALIESLRAEKWPIWSENARRRLFLSGMALLHATMARADLPSARPLPPQLREVLQKIEHYPGENLSNVRLAKLCNLSVGSFTRLFAHHLQMAPATYVRRTRLNYASRLLAFTEMSVEQIAQASGFPNRHYFTRMFARHAGCGPAAFRKGHQSGQNTRS